MADNPKHTIRIDIDESAALASCSCGWAGRSRFIDITNDYAWEFALIDGLRHSIEVVMAMPMLPDEYRSKFVNQG